MRQASGNHDVGDACCGETLVRNTLEAVATMRFLVSAVSILDFLILLTLVPEKRLAAFRVSIYSKFRVRRCSKCQPGASNARGGEDRPGAVCRLFWLRPGETIRLDRREGIWLSTDANAAAEVSLTGAYVARSVFVAGCLDRVAR
ncbi:hypothetical protein [Cupriavidus sp. D39]|uniref:hypothetical protein n=1 Tax=Cupriavidus sp. D39 TaxID=2997877 RepID=UPI002270D706|nr:hypothetical protein [Cupriavidus sp. D39]MCY0858585.1 hypothetical protein [Cupriavidus sp. D39]